MIREIELEEYFEMKSSDRLEYVDNLVDKLSEWEPSIHVKIEDILAMARVTGEEEPAIELLSKIKSMQVIHALRRHITKDEPLRGMNVSILINAIAQNMNIDFDTRYYALEYYVDNPRYTSDNMMNMTLFEAFELLEQELKVKLTDVQEVINLLNAKAALIKKKNNALSNKSLKDKM